MQGDLDITHPIGFGYVNREIYTHRDTLIAFDPPENPYATIVSIPENAVASGFASKDNQEKLAGKSNGHCRKTRQGFGNIICQQPQLQSLFLWLKQNVFKRAIFF